MLNYFYKIYTMIEMTKQTLDDIIKYIKKSHSLNSDDEDLFNYRLLIFRAIDNLLKSYFGRYNTNLIWNYARDTNSPFSSIDELYNYLSDPFSHIVSPSSALTVSQLCTKYPEEEMFKRFQIFINNNSNV